MTKLFKLDEIDCAVCAAKAEKKVSKIKGISSAAIDFMSQRLCIETDNYTDELLEEIKSEINKVESDCEVIPL